MSVMKLLEVSLILHIAMNTAVFFVMAKRGNLRIFPQLGWLLSADAISVLSSVLLLFHRKALGLGIDHAFQLYFYTNWILNGAILLLRVLVVYSVFAEAMRPMAGLHKAGKIIFRWVGVVSALVALAMLAGPGSFSSVTAMLEIFSRLQQGVSVLTLCLLVFVCFAVRPLGLTFRSHLFGVSLGLGVAATVELVQAAWAVTQGAHSLYSPIFLFSTLGFCVSLLIWGSYFALPEPKRQMILLPTTSPFFFWNRISEILGDAPGHVAVAGFTPDMLAPAEIEMLTAATAEEASEVAESRFPARSAMPSLRRELPPRPQPSLA